MTGAGGPSGGSKRPDAGARRFPELGLAIPLVLTDGLLRIPQTFRAPAARPAPTHPLIARLWTTMGDSSSSTGESVSLAGRAEFGDGDEPPSLTPLASRRHPAWAGVSEADWNDWRWQSQN